MRLRGFRELVPLLRGTAASQREYDSLPLEAVRN
jgi:hypothetical protein